MSANLQIYLTENVKIVDQNLKSQQTFNDFRIATMTSNLNRWFICYAYAATGPLTYVYSFKLDYNAD